MSRVTVTLGQDERDALVKLALTEMRNPRDQARYILRRELERCGFLPATAEREPRAEPKPERQEAHR